MGASRVQSFKGYNADNTWNGDNTFTKTVDYSPDTVYFFTLNNSINQALYYNPTQLLLTLQEPGGINDLSIILAGDFALSGGDWTISANDITASLGTGITLTDANLFGIGDLVTVDVGTALITLHQNTTLASGKNLTLTGEGTNVPLYLNGSSVVTAGSVTAPITLSSGAFDFDVSHNFTSADAWTGNHDFGVDGSSAFDLNLYSDEAGAQLTWDSAPSATTTPLLTYVGKDSPHYRHIDLSVTSTSVVGSGQLQLLTGTVNLNQTTGGLGIAIPMVFNVNDNRVIDSGAGVDFIRGMSFTLNRSATFQSSYAGGAALQGIFFQLTDVGNYTGNSTALGVAAFKFEGTIDPDWDGSAAQGYTVTMIDFAPSIVGGGTNIANVTFNFLGITHTGTLIAFPGVLGPGTLTYKGSNWSPGLTWLGSGTGFAYEPYVAAPTYNIAYGDIKILHYNPTITAATPDSEYVVYATRSGIALASDGSAGSDAGGFLRLGAAEDAEIYYDGTDLQINPKLVGSGYAVIAGTLQVDEGLVTNHVDITSTGSDDGSSVMHLVDASGGAVTRTLPSAASSSGQSMWFKKTDSSANYVTIDGNGSETIDGETTLDLVAQYETVHLFCDGTEWWIM